MTNTSLTSGPEQQKNFWVVVPAAGTGKRMQADRPKQYLKLCDKTILEHTLSRLLRHPAIVGVVVVLAEQDAFWQTTEFAADPRVKVATGGMERCHSVVAGLQRLADIVVPQDWVLIHDVARPCIGEGDIDSLLGAASGGADGYLLGAPVRDTMKQTDAAGRVIATVERQGLWHAFTPQMFRLEPLLAALESCLMQGLLVTDEASAMEQCGFSPQMVAGNEENIKVTRESDLPLAEWLLRSARS